VLEIAIEAAKETGKFLKKNLGKVREIQPKAGQERNLVTEIDRRSEEIVIEKIRRHYPNHNILAEESGSRTVGTSEYKWIIDPLDGTTNFTHGLPVFCVSIGLELRGELLLGVIYDPNLDELFVGEKGKGSSMNGKRIRVSQSSPLMKTLLVTGFPYDIVENPANAIGHFVNFLMNAQAVRRMGSAAIDLAYVAAGRYDGFWEVALNPWDMAAGALIVQEAGGKLSDFSGNQHSIYTKEIVASNGLVHEEMVKILKKGMPPNATGNA